MKSIYSDCTQFLSEAATTRADFSTMRDRPRNLEERDDKVKRVCFATSSDRGVLKSPAMSQTTVRSHSESRRNFNSGVGPLVAADASESSGSCTQSQISVSESCRDDKEFTACDVNIESRASSSSSSSSTSSASLSTSSLVQSPPLHAHSHKFSSRRAAPASALPTTARMIATANPPLMKASVTWADELGVDDSTISRIVSKSPYQTAHRVVERMTRCRSAHYKSTLDDNIDTETENTVVFMQLVSVISQLKTYGLSAADVLTLSRSALGILKDPAFAFTEGQTGHWEEQDYIDSTAHTHSRPLPSTLSISTDEILGTKTATLSASASTSTSSSSSLSASKPVELPSMTFLQRPPSPHGSTIIGAHAVSTPVRAAVRVSAVTTAAVAAAAAAAATAPLTNTATMLNTTGPDSSWIQDLCVRLPQVNSKLYRELGEKFARAAHQQRCMHTTEIAKVCMDDTNIDHTNANRQNHHDENNHCNTLHPQMIEEHEQSSISKRSSNWSEPKSSVSHEKDTPLGTVSSCTSIVSQHSTASITPRPRSHPKGMPHTPTLYFPLRRNQESTMGMRATDGKCVAGVGNASVTTAPATVIAGRGDESINATTSAQTGNFSSLLSLGIPASATQLRGAHWTLGRDRPNSVAKPSEQAQAPSMNEQSLTTNPVSKLMDSPKAFNHDDPKFFTILESFAAAPMDTITIASRHAARDKLEASPALSSCPPVRFDHMNQSRDQLAFTPTVMSNRNAFPSGPYSLYYRTNQHDPALISGGAGQHQGFLNETLHCVPLQLNAQITSGGAGGEHGETLDVLPENSGMPCMPGLLINVPIAEFGLLNSTDYANNQNQSKLEAMHDSHMRASGHRQKSIFMSARGPAKSISGALSRPDAIAEGDAEDETEDEMEVDTLTAQREVRQAQSMMHARNIPQHSQLAARFLRSQRPNLRRKPKSTASMKIGEREMDKLSGMTVKMDLKQRSDSDGLSKTESKISPGKASSHITDLGAVNAMKSANTTSITKLNANAISKGTPSSASAASHFTTTSAIGSSRNNLQEATTEDSDSIDENEADTNNTRESLNIVITDNDPVVVYLMDLRLSTLDGLLQLVKPLSQLPRKFHVEQHMIAWWPIDVPKKHVSKLSKRDKVSVIVAILRSFADTVKPEEFLELMTQRLRSSLEATEVLREYIEKALTALFRYPVFIFPENEPITPSSIFTFRKMKKRMIPELQRASGLNNRQHNSDAINHELVGDSNSSSDTGEYSSDDERESDSRSSTSLINGGGGSSGSGAGGLSAYDEMSLNRRRTRSLTIRGRAQQK